MIHLIQFKGQIKLIVFSFSIEKNITHLTV